LREGQRLAHAKPRREEKARKASQGSIKARLSAELISTHQTNKM